MAQIWFIGPLMGGCGFMGDRNAERVGHFEQGGNNRQAVERNSSDSLPGMQRNTAQQGRYLPISHICAGWHRMELLALRTCRGWVL